MLKGFKGFKVFRIFLTAHRYIVVGTSNLLVFFASLRLGVRNLFCSALLPKLWTIDHGFRTWSNRIIT